MRPTSRKALPILILTLTTAVLVVALLAVRILHKSAMEGQRHRLAVSVRRQAELIKLFVETSGGPERAIDALSGLNDSFAQLEGEGQFRLIRREGERIHQLLPPNRQDPSGSRQPPAEVLSEGLRRLVVSGRSGTTIERDHDARWSLAAYAPVPNAPWGVVLVFDLAALRAPFNKASLILLIAAVIPILLGTSLLLRVGRPMVRELEELNRALDRRARELDEINQTLDLRVLERTRELRDAQYAGVKMMQDIEDGRSREQTVGEALRNNEALTRSIVETAVDGIIVINEVGTIESMNPAAEKIFGYPLDEALGRNVKMLMPPPYHDEHDGYLANFLRTGVKKIIGIGREVLVQHKNGTRFAIELAVSEMRFGTERKFTGIVRDITARKQVEAALRESEARTRLLVETAKAERRLKEFNSELERKNSEMEQFLYMVSHDLRSPLVTIRGFAGYIGKDLATGQTEHVSEYQQRIDNAVERMMRLLDDLLKFSRIGGVSHQAKPVDMTRLLRSIAQAHEAELAQRNVRWDIQENMPTLRVDEDRVMQAFENLLVNAMIHGCNGPQPRISVGVREVGDEVRIFVQDNGRGIPLDHHARIFEPFRRLRGDTQGTGIGLAIVKRVVENHQGRVWVESAPGQGATFWVSFPTTVVEPAYA